MSTVPGNTDDIDNAANTVISRSSVLIFGGLLIGLTVSNAVHAGIRSHVFLAGVCGLVAYIALNYAAMIRRRKTLTRRYKETVSHLEARVDQHIHTAD